MGVDPLGRKRYETASTLQVFFAKVFVGYKIIDIYLKRNYVRQYIQR